MLGTNQTYDMIIFASPYNNIKHPTIEIKTIYF